MRRSTGMTFISRSEQETQRLAQSLARGLRPNDCLALLGNFGSGKTTFVKGLARGLRFTKKGYVCSPSFVILKIYPGRLPLYHFDLYRLQRTRDFQDIGFDEFIASGGVAAIEWADKIRDLLPQETLTIRFAIAGPRRRRIVFSAATARLRQLLRRLKKESRPARAGFP